MLKKVKYNLILTKVKIESVLRKPNPEVEKLKLRLEEDLAKCAECKLNGNCILQDEIKTNLQFLPSDGNYRDSQDLNL